MAESFRAVRPAADEHNPYFSLYIDRVPDGDIVEILGKQIPETVEFLRAIPESRADYRYAEGKWSIRQIVGHLSDGERVFQYRAMRFSRLDTTPVPGFDENLFVANAPFAHMSMEDLISELEHLRMASIRLLSGLDAEAMGRRGVANGNEISVRALAFVMAGHVAHHLDIIRTRYLQS
ncbi:MAG TPA: DinB family protein [Gemmatimonadaceae bacterium]|nr:DinB family protein [Gemmatimonadaceae bacterium]